MEVTCFQGMKKISPEDKENYKKLELLEHSHNHSVLPMLLEAEYL